MSEDLWEAKVRNFAKAGFLDHQFWSKGVIHSLVTRNTIRLHQNNSAFITSIEDYLQRCGVIGSLISPESSYASDIQRDNVIVSIRGCPRLLLIQELGKNLNIQP
jgi:hypothetical protein